jgi:hypothetical protein
MKPVIFDFKIFLMNDKQNDKVIENENLNKIKLRSPETRNNNIIIPIKINENEKKYIPLIFKTPKMYMPFKPHISNQQSGYVRLAFDNIKIDNNLKDFYNFINSTETYLENKLNNSGMINLNNNNSGNNSSNKSKNKITFKKTIQKTEGYADYFNLNFNMNDITIYDNDLSLISIDKVNGNFYAYFIIELTGFYYKQKTKEIKLIWSLVQFKLDKVKNKIQECLFLDEEELEQEKLKTLKDKDKDFKIENLKEKKINFIKNHVLLEKFFKMLSIGIPKMAVQHKMSLSNIDIRFLDFSSDTDIDKLPIELKNKLNDNNIDTNININDDNNISNQNDININDNNKSINLNKNLLSNIKNHKLKNVNINLTEHKSLKNKIIEKLSNKSLLVPSLEQINEAYKKLNKVNKNTYAF